MIKNPEVIKLKPYKGFEIYKYRTANSWGNSIHYEAYKYKGKAKEVEEYIDECSTLAECKRAIDSLLQERLYEAQKELEQLGLFWDRKDNNNDSCF